MKIPDLFNQAITSRRFVANGNEDRYSVQHCGPFVIRRYVPKGQHDITALPNHVWVDRSHPQHKDAFAFIDKNNRAVRRAREHGIAVG